MVLSGEISECIEKLAPLNLAEDWDNSGLLLGYGGKVVKRVLVSLDITAATVREALEINADMIVSHHPFIFKGLKRIDPEDTRGRLVYELIRKDICVYCAHTNLDVAHGGLNDFLAVRLGLKDVSNLRGGNNEGLGRVGILEPPAAPQVFLDSVKALLGTRVLKIIGNTPDLIRKAAVFSGSFDNDFSGILNNGIDVLVTGDIKYHTAVDIMEKGLFVIDAGHYNTERIVVDLLAEYLNHEFPLLDIRGSLMEADPFSFY